MTEAAGGVADARAALAEGASLADRLDSRLGVFTKRFPSPTRVVSGRTDGLAQGGIHRPLDGMPIAIKDLIYTEETPTLGQSRGYLPGGPQPEGRAVRRLRRAGAIIVGKTTTMELGAGLLKDGASSIVPRNPWSELHWPGGSSSGSAIAVATGMVAAALGTDTGGSVRAPAALCGITGFKPTFAAVPAEGMIAGGVTYEVIGPMARSAAECDLLFQVMAGRDVVALPAVDPESITVGWSDDHQGVEESVRERMTEAVALLRARGVVVRPVKIPDWDALALVAAVGTIAEHFASMSEQLAERWELFGRDTRRIIAVGATLTSRDYLITQSARRMLRQRVEDATAQVDYLLLPTAPREAPLLAELDGIGEFTPFTSPVNALGWPAVSIPAGFGSHGLPVGLQLIGKPHTDRSLLAFADFYQGLTDWHTRVPPIVSAFDDIRGRG